MVQQLAAQTSGNDVPQRRHPQPADEGHSSGRDPRCVLARICRGLTFAAPGSESGVWGSRDTRICAGCRRSAPAPVLVDDDPAAGSGALRTGRGRPRGAALVRGRRQDPGISRYRRKSAAGGGRHPVAGGLGLWMQEADRDRVACITGTKGKRRPPPSPDICCNDWGFRCFIGGNIGKPPWDPQAPAGRRLLGHRDLQLPGHRSARGAPRRRRDLAASRPPQLARRSRTRTTATSSRSARLPGAEVTVSNAEDPVVLDHRSSSASTCTGCPTPALPSGWAGRLPLAGPAQHGQRAHGPSGARRTRRLLRPRTTKRSRAPRRASSRWPAGFRSSAPSTA